MNSFSIRNFGCRVNQAEAFAWAAEFQARGLAYEPDSGRGDLVVVNSCTLTSRADRDVRKFIRHVHRGNPAARIVVTGCLAERMPAETASLPGVWKVIPNADKDALPQALLSETDFDGRWKDEPGSRARRANSENSAGEGIARERTLGHARIAPEFSHSFSAPRPQTNIGGFVGDSGKERTGRGSRELWAIPERAYRRRAFVKIQDGCEMRCSFCVIPSVRGKSRSVPPVEVLARLGDLEALGFREVVLSGIHLASYGRDLDPATSLLELLKRIEALPGGLRVRLSSLDPRLVDAELIDFAAAASKIRPHFHLSLQHATERVLRAMGRAGSAEAYRRILDRWRKRSPRAALGADIIVGFPGETEEDFRAAEEFLEASPLTAVHVFAYSGRPGTPAALMPRVADRVRKDRADRLRAFARKRDLDFRRTQEGRVEEAVVISRRGAEAAVLTANAIDVRVPLCEAPEGEAVRVRIGLATGAGTSGEIVAAPEAA